MARGSFCGGGSSKITPSWDQWDTVKDTRHSAVGGEDEDANIQTSSSHHHHHPGSSNSCPVIENELQAIDVPFFVDWFQEAINW